MVGGNSHKEIELISRYLDQQARLPRDIRNRVETLWQKRPVLIYALADLDKDMHLTSRWVVLGATHLAIVLTADHSGETSSINIGLSKIRTIRETPGLSCTQLSLLGEENTPPLTVLSYTHRQATRDGKHHLYDRTIYRRKSNR